MAAAFQEAIPGFPFPQTRFALSSSAVALRYLVPTKGREIVVRKLTGWWLHEPGKFRPELSVLSRSASASVVAIMTAAAAKQDHTITMSNRAAIYELNPSPGYDNALWGLYLITTDSPPGRGDAEFHVRSFTRISRLGPFGRMAKGIHREVKAQNGPSEQARG